MTMREYLEKKYDDQVQTAFTLLDPAKYGNKQPLAQSRRLCLLPNSIVIVNRLDKTSQRHESVPKPVQNLNVLKARGHVENPHAGLYMLKMDAGGEKVGNGLEVDKQIDRLVR